SNLSEFDYKAPSPRKTGTTIAGIVYKDGVILGADTRATDDMVVASKNCMKIHYIAPKIYCCGAGVAADLKQMLFRYQGHVGSSLIVGGVDVTGAHLYSVYPHGSYDKLPYVSMGSGAAAAVSVLEDRFKPNMEIEEAKQLVRDAIAAGIFCDLGSGSNVDLCVITEAGAEYLQGYDKLATRGKREGQYRYKPGTTAVLTKTVTPLSLDVVSESVQIMNSK
uniref:Proteasome subunit beta n=1 Tax=Mola mola TaxID=94237 RepID=A0A3Q3WE57_MOLML